MVIISSVKFVLVDILADFIYWPIWWYTVGLKDRTKFSLDQIKKTWTALGLTIWLKNMFTPMYADRSIAGRAISFPVRVVILIWRLVWWLIWVGIILILLLIWIAAPVAVGWVIRDHF